MLELLKGGSAPAEDARHRRRRPHAAWQDPNYNPTQGAFYHVRALQDPTCRWSTYDAIRLGMEPNPDVPATIRERARSSPIWIDPAG